MAGVHIDGEAVTANGWVTKIVAFIISMCFVGVCVWVATTTFKNDTELKLMKQQSSAQQRAYERNTTELTDKLVNVADQLSQVSTNLANVSANLYTKDEAAKEAQRVNNELNNLKIQQAKIQGSLDLNQYSRFEISNGRRTQ
ncbi:TMhelix containing protein [Vibrio phage vB_ValS_PJ32]|nr:TMhelix containing protein [Vibrio phage vB_ValS_PJ32]